MPTMGPTVFGVFVEKETILKSVHCLSVHPSVCLLHVLFPETVTLFDMRFAGKGGNCELTRMPCKRNVNFSFIEYRNVGYQIKSPDQYESPFSFYISWKGKKGTGQKGIT